MVCVRLCATLLAMTVFYKRNAEMMEEVAAYLEELESWVKQERDWLKAFRDNRKQVQLEVGTTHQDQIQCIVLTH